MKLKYVTEFIAQEAKNEDSEVFTIQGKAIYENISMNRVKYEAQELEKAATTLTGKPLMTDHVNSVDNVIGKVINAWYDATNKAVMFTAEIHKKLLDEKLLVRIQKGLVDKVSIGADVASVAYKKIKDDLIAIVKGITFVELSLVAVPGNSDAGFTAKTNFTQALTEMLDDKELESKKEELKMEEVEELKKQLAETMKAKEQLEADKEKTDADAKQAEDVAKKASDDAKVEAETAAEKFKTDATAEKVKAEGLEKELKEMKEKAHEELVKKVAEAKVAAKLAEKVEDEVKALSEKSDEVLAEILSTVEQVKPVEEKKEEKKEVKGKVATSESGETEEEDGFVIERGSNGLMSLYQVEKKEE